MIKEVINEKETLRGASFGCAQESTSSFPSLAQTLQYSEDAEIRYYGGNAICVDNFDTEVEFGDEVKFQASVKRDKKGSVEIVPHGSNPSHNGPRSITLCDTGVARLKSSTKGNNIKVEIILPAEIATSGNFLRNLRELFQVYRSLTPSPSPAKRGE